MARLIRFADCPAVPWKNGGGTTHDLWKLEAADRSVLVRISAAVISGAQGFSRFEGFDRVILQLAGPQVVLTIAGREFAMLPSAPIAFRGEAEVSSRVDGVALDLNLIALRSRFHPAMRVERLAQCVASPNGVCAVLALEEAQAVDAAETRLQLHDVMLLEPGESISFKQAVQVVVMELHPAMPR